MEDWLNVIASLVPVAALFATLLKWRRDDRIRFEERWARLEKSIGKNSEELHIHETRCSEIRKQNKTFHKESLERLGRLEKTMRKDRRRLYKRIEDLAAREK